MDLRTLRYFAVVVEAGSLLSAASVLHMSQPSLSVAMTKLENELGVALLERSSRGVTPTPAGRYLLEASSRLLGDAEEMVNSLKRFAEGTAGTLNLAAVPALSWHRVPQLIRRMSAVLPETDVLLSSPSPWRAMEMLREGTADVAAVVVDNFQRFADRHAGEFDIFDWGNVPIVAALPPDRPHDGEKLSLEYFEGENMVLPRRMTAVPSLPEAVEAAFYRHHILAGSVRITETFQEGVALIEAGVAVGLLPDPDSKSLTRFNIARHELVPEIPPLAAVVMTRRGDATRQSIRTFLQEAGVRPNHSARKALP